MSNFLSEVAAQTRKRIDMQKVQVPLAQLKAMPHPSLAQTPFKQMIRKPGQMALIAELKHASPSAGVIRPVSSIQDRIKAYERGGASALSILTEEDYFHGSPQYLVETRKYTTLPLLRKDFIIDVYQIVESRQLGADAILLISSLLAGGQLKEFIHAAKENKLDALVEVHSESDLEHAVASDAEIIGINNRDLHTLKVDVATAPKLLSKITKMNVIKVVESGISNATELPPLHDLGADAVLIGETLMRSDQPENLVKEFANACRK